MKATYAVLATLRHSEDTLKGLEITPLDHLQTTRIYCSPSPSKTYHRKVTKKKLNLLGRRKRKIPDEESTGSLSKTTAKCVHCHSSEPASTTHQENLRRPWRSSDKESPSVEHSTLWYKTTTGRKQHVQGDGLREGGLWEGLNSGFQKLPGEQEACRTLSTPEAGGILPVQPAELLLPVAPGDSQVPWFGYRVRIPTAPSSHVPRWQGSLPASSQMEWLKLLEGNYSSTAMQPFCCLSRKKAKPFDLLPKTKKQIKC